MFVFDNITFFIVYSLPVQINYIRNWRFSNAVLILVFYLFSDLNLVHWDTKLIQADFECFRVSMAKSLLSRQIETSSPRLHMNRTFCIWHWSTLWNLEEMSRLSFFKSFVVARNGGGVVLRLRIQTFSCISNNTLYSYKLTNVSWNRINKDFFLRIPNGFVPIVSCCCLNSFRRPLAFTTSLGLYIAIRHA